MHKLTIYLFLLSLNTSCKHKESPPAPLTKEEVLAFIQLYDNAWNIKNNKAVDSLYGRNYQYFTSMGGVSSRARNLEILIADYYQLNSAKRSEIEISIEDNTAIVSSRWQGTGVWRGELFDDNQRCGLVIQKQGKELKLISEHCVDIVTEPSF